MLMEQALSQLGGMLGREGWGSRSSRSTWGWSESDGWRLLDSTETTSGGRWVPIEEVDSLDEDEDEDES